MKTIDRNSFMDFIFNESDNKKIFKTIIEPTEAWVMELVPQNATLRTYDDFRGIVSQAVGTGPGDIIVVGSSKVGFSMSPMKNFREFDKEQSDIDVAVISEKLFDEFWNELIVLFYRQGCFVKQEFQRDVFLRFLNIERDKSLPSTALRDWHKKMDGLKREVFTKFGLPMALKYRIYRDRMSFENYHIDGFRILKKRIEELRNANIE